MRVEAGLRRVASGAEALARATRVSGRPPWCNSSRTARAASSKEVTLTALSSRRPLRLRAGTVGQWLGRISLGRHPADHAWLAVAMLAGRQAAAPMLSAAQGSDAGPLSRTPIGQQD